MSEPTLALEVQGMHKRFGDHEVLKGIDLNAHTGDVISIVGSSGSGKSTFLRCVNLLETPDAGDVYLHGELIHMKTLRDGSRKAADRRQLQRIRARLVANIVPILFTLLCVGGTVGVIVYKRAQDKKAAEAEAPAAEENETAEEAVEEVAPKK